MFSLDIPTEPYWIDLPQGVRIQVRPIDGQVAAAARHFAMDCAVKLMQMRAEREAAGMPASDMLDLSDPSMREGFTVVQLAAGLARYGIIAWEGVGDAAGEPLAFSKDRAERLASHPMMTQPFLDAYYAALDRLASEGNASASALNGSTGSDADIATVAPNGAQTALAS